MNEKVLLRLMKNAWRGSGYHVAQAGLIGGLWIGTGRWAVLLHRDAVPRKVLALLVEHIGEVPQESAWRCSKAGGAQSMLLESELRAIETVLDAEHEADPAVIYYTGMTANGWELWQQPWNNRVSAYDPELADLGGETVPKAKTMPETAGPALVWQDYAGMALVMPGQIETIVPADVLALLESTRLVKE